MTKLFSITFALILYLIPYKILTAETSNVEMAASEILIWDNCSLILGPFFPPEILPDQKQSKVYCIIYLNVLK